MSDSAKLELIVDGARGLFERLERGEPIDIPDSSNSTWRECWQEQIAPGDDRGFRKRLAWDRLESSQVAAGPSVFKAPLPRWAATLRTALDGVPDRVSPSRIFSREPLPFQDVWVPLVVWASGVATAREPTLNDLVSRSALADLERCLLKRLCETGGQVLLGEFLLAGKRIRSGAGQSSYQRFVADFLRTGFFDIFQRFPVLARLVGTLLTQWIEATALFGRRLAEDIHQISSVFASGSRLGEITRVTFAGDFHQGGQTTLLLRFQNGLQLVYKPRGIGLLEAWTELATWINRTAAAPPLAPLSSLSRGTYGWVSYVSHQPVRGRTNAVEFYRRAGALLGVVYLLGGIDCHAENLIASGAQPTLIDLETVIQPSLVPGRVGPSVLETGLLPRWSNLAGRPFDGSALGCLSIRTTACREYSWRHTNSARMRCHYRQMRFVNLGNRPFPRGSTLRPTHFVRELTEGFREIHALLRQDRRRLESGPLQHFRQRRVRVVLRPTALYTELLRLRLQPRFLASGTMDEMLMDRLAGPWLAEKERPQLWPVLKEEREALVQADVPVFYSRADSRDLILPSGAVLREVLEASAWERILVRLGNLNDRDLSRQCELISESWCGWRMAQKGTEFSRLLAATSFKTGFNDPG